MSHEIVIVLLLMFGLRGGVEAKIEPVVHVRELMPVDNKKTSENAA